MIKIEFNDLDEPSLLNAAHVAEYVGVEFKSKNEELSVYQSHISTVFFIAQVLNLLIYIYKLSQKKQNEQHGAVKLLILYGLFYSLVFNFPYKLFTQSTYFFIDTVINASTETYLLFLNLVLSHAMYASPQISPFSFYAPKMALSALVFLGLTAWSYADVLEYQAYISSDFEIN